VIRRAAKLNNITLPGTILASRSLEIMVTPSKQTSAAPTAKSIGRNGCVKTQKVDNGRVLSDLQRFTRPKGKEVEVKTTRYTLLDVFRNFRLAMYTLCMSFLWFVRTQFSVILRVIQSKGAFTPHAVQCDAASCGVRQKRRNMLHVPHRTATASSMNELVNLQL